MHSVDGTSVTFTSPRGLGDDELDIIEDHIRKTYSPEMAEKIIDGLYNEESELVTIVQVTTTATVTIKSES